MVKVRRILVAAISLCLMLGLMFGAVPIDASPGTIVVPDDYPTIQHAIDAASSGDTVYVRPATYYEHVTITKALTLQGEDRETTIVDGSGSGNVIYVTTNHVTISGLTVAKGENGIYLIPDWSIHHITVRYVIITSNSGTAFCAPHSGGYHLIEDCIISNNGMASYAHQFGNGIIRNCEVFGNDESFSVAWGSNTQIINNVVHHNANGIYFDSMSNSVIERNIVYANTGFGISNGYVAQDNTVRDNIVCDNGWGIGSWATTRGIKVYHNDLIGNTIQALDDSTANIWDNGYPSGGNYWSDYTGVDNFSGPGQNLPGSDGIGDTPYTLSGSQDDYPLMEPFGGHGAGPHTLTISSTDGGNVTTPGEGTFSPYNACEVVDLVATADTGYQFVNWTGDTGTIANGHSANTTITMIGNYSIIANFKEIPPAIGVTPTSLPFIAGEGTDPDDGYLDIWNSGGGTLNWMLSDDAAWLSEAPMSGNSTGEHDNVTVSVNTSGMAAGLYSANITITGSTNVTVPVTLEIKPATIDVVRNLPDVTYPGETFDVYVNFTAPADKFNSIGLTDFAPDGWNVTVDETWCTPNADAVLVTDNKAEIAWFGEPDIGFDEGTNFTAMYKVTVPDDAELGINEFPLGDCSKASLYYYIGSHGPYTSCVIGEHEVTVIVTIDVMRNLPDDALDFDAEYPGDTFDVYVNFTAPVADFNSIGLTDFAPPGWLVETEDAWCSPAASWNKSNYNKAEYAWAGGGGDYVAGTNFTAKYRVTIPATASAGINEWPECMETGDPCGETSNINSFSAWVEYWFSASGPFESSICGDYQKIITVPGHVVGETRDVNADLLDTVTVVLYEEPAEIGDEPEGSDSSSIVPVSSLPEGEHMSDAGGNFTTWYENCADDTGYYYQVASKYCYYTIDTSNMSSPRNFSHPDYIDWSTPELLVAGYRMDFEADYGLICKAADMSYAMTSINHWLFVPVDEYGAPHPEWQIHSWKAMESIHSWQYPCGCSCI